MENMIKKLLKELSNERKVNSRMNLEIKRLNNEVIELEKKIKTKNDNIYQLEMKIIYIEKSYGRSLQNNNNTSQLNNIAHKNNMNTNTKTNTNTNTNKSTYSNNKGVTLTPTHNKN